MHDHLAWGLVGVYRGTQLDTTYARLDDGSVHRFDSFGSDQQLAVHPADGKPVTAQSIAPDRFGGLFLADPANARVLQVGIDGSVVRQLRDPALGGLRQIQSSVDGRQVFGLVASGVLVFDTPEL